jgi:type VII secretion protein EccB
MATKKDLVEAQSFSRRRLTTAFVSGAPGGREVEPDRPLRAVAGGFALATVLVLGSMAFGWLRSALPDDWQNDRLVIAQDSGARYVSVKGTLHPVVNTTSARLLIPANRFTVIAVPDEEIAAIRRGPTLGILGAPDSLTPPERLVNTGWVSCLLRGEQVSTTVGRGRPAAPVPGGALVVRSGGRTFVVADGRRHAVAPKDTTVVTVGLDLAGRPPVPAPAGWLNLFPAGPDLGPLTVDDVGKPLPGMALPEGVTVGSLIRLGDRQYLVNPQGDLEPMSAVAAKMYQAGSGQDIRPIDVQANQIADLDVIPPRIVPADWPEDITSAIDTTPCATLTAAAGKAPAVSLGTTADAAGANGGGTVVATGSGALVRAVSGSALNEGRVFAVDQTATAYALDGVDAEMLARLGYRAADVTPVPQAWSALLRPGPPLSTAAARTVVTGAS